MKKFNKDTEVFTPTDLQYVVEYDYARSWCNCNATICRCTKIIDTRIDKINITKVINKLFERNPCTGDIDEYCFDRLCYIFKVYDKNYYEVETCGGYYGEEIRGVYFEQEEQIVNHYKEVTTLFSNIEKIKYCLNMEYGYLLDVVENATSATIVSVSPDEIKLPQQEYFKKLNENVIEDYTNRKLPIAICIKDGIKYRLLDGYHRFVANKNSDTVNIIVIE